MRIRANLLLPVLLTLMLPGASRAASTEPFILPPPPDGSPARYSAAEFEYQGSTTGANAEVFLRGDVELRESTWTLRADELRLDMNRRWAEARGGFEIDDGLTVLRGESGSFDLEAHTGSVAEVRAEYPPWRIWASTGTLDAAGKGHFRRAVFTSCSAAPPHYHFRSSRLHLKPKKWMTATHVRFYVGKVPLFYSPFLWKSLRPKKVLHTRVIPGYDRRNGGWLRTNTMFSITPAMYGKVFLDYYTAQGLGAGGELEYHPSEDGRGALYGYRVREQHNGDERWTVLGSHYQAFGSSWAVQGRLQAQSDPEVNNHYLRSNAFRVTTELVNGAALLRRTALTTTRLSYSRTDTGLPGGSFARRSESSPRLEVQTAQLSWRPLPALFTLGAFADNDYERDRGFQQRRAGASVEATQSRVLARGISITPRAAFREVYEDRRDTLADLGSTRTVHDAYTGFYDVGGNLRVDSPIGNWDGSYLLSRRLKVNTFQEDSGAPDHGVERNEVVLQDTVRPDRKVLTRVRAGYDFRTHRERDLGFRQRVLPITGDLVLLPKSGLQLSLRDEYQLIGGNRAFLLQADWGDRDADFLGFGVSHTRDRADSYQSGLEAAWTPGRSAWRFGGALRQQVRTPGGFALRGFQVYEKELWVTRGFHDFLTRVQVRFRPGGVKEASINAELRFEKDPERRVEKKDWESEWFPWRKGRTPTDGQ